jgi:hypothetical protein
MHLAAACFLGLVAAGQLLERLLQVLIVSGCAASNSARALSTAGGWSMGIAYEVWARSARARRRQPETIEGLAPVPACDRQHVPLGFRVVATDPPQ